MSELSPEAEVLAEKTARAIAALDHAQGEIHKAIDLLPTHEQAHMGSRLKSTIQIALASRLCHMTIGGMGMDEAQVNGIALDLLEELNKLGDDLRKDLKKKGN